MSELKSVTDASFDQDVLQSEKPVIVDFWAPWCGPCRMLGPVLEEIADEQGDKVSIVKVNVDENPAVAAQYGITSIPAVYGFTGGQHTISMIGARPKPEVEATFGEFIA